MISCNQPKKNGDPCEKAAVAYIVANSEHVPACPFHTSRAGIGNVLTLDEVKGILLTAAASDHAQRILRDARHLEASERAVIATEILLADIVREVAS